MTGFHRATIRRTVNGLSGRFGPDRGKRIVVTLTFAGGVDTIRMRPERSRREEIIAVEDIYHFAIRSRVNRERLEKAREKKERLAQQRASRRVAYADAKLRREVRAVST